MAHLPMPGASLVDRDKHKAMVLLEKLRMDGKIGHWRLSRVDTRYVYVSAQVANYVSFKMIRISRTNWKVYGLPEVFGIELFE